ncbi:MAG: hypothetical protein V3U11_08385, partial [Planctomycetota bacterium]
MRLLLLAVVLAGTGTFLWHAWLSLSFPFPLDYGEAPLLDQALRLSRGQTIYDPDLSTPPFTVANYPPLYPLTLVPLVWLLGPAFLGGRLVAVLSCLASAWFVGLTVRRMGSDRIAAVSAGGLLLVLPGVVLWSGLVRVDLLALALATGALCLLAAKAAEGAGTDGKWRLRWVVLLLVGAVLARQSYALAAPFAAVLWVSRDSRRRALGLGAAVVAGCMLPLGALTLATRGGFFLHTVTANVNEFSGGRMVAYLVEFAGQAPLLLLLAGAFLVSRRRVGWWLLAPFLVGAGLSALTVGKVGSNVNYLLELSVALCLIAGAMLLRVRTLPWTRVGLTAALTLQTAFLIWATWTDTLPRLRERLAERPELELLDRLVRETPDPLLADEQMGLLTRLGRPLQLQPFEMTQLASTGLWDPDLLNGPIERGEFPLVLVHYLPGTLVHQERWLPETLAVLRRHYRPTGMLAGSVIYRPAAAMAVEIPAPRGEQLPWADATPLPAPTRISRARFVMQPDIAVAPGRPDLLA